MANPQRRGTITVEIVGEKRVKKAIVDAKGLLPEVAEQIIHDAGDEMVQLAQINLHRMKPPGIDTGALVQSIKNQKSKLTSIVYSDVKHSVFVEYGTRPHFPPIEPILAWVKRKLHVPEKRAKGVAYLVARKIAKQGTRARPFFGNAFAVIRKRLMVSMKQALSAAAGTVGK